MRKTDFPFPGTCWRATHPVNAIDRMKGLLE